MQESFELIAKTFQGLEEVLAQELIELGANDVQIGRRMVSFSGNQEMMYRANFCLRTAVRILKPISHFRARNADEVYKAVKEIEWKDILDLDTSFVVDTTVYSTEFRNSKFVAYKVKDAIATYDWPTAEQRLKSEIATASSHTVKDSLNAALNRVQRAAELMDATKSLVLLDSISLERAHWLDSLTLSPDAGRLVAGSKIGRAHV